MLDDLGRDGCAIEGVPCSILSPSACIRHIGERDFLAGVALEQINIERVAFSDTILPSASFDNCESHSCERL